MNEQESNNLTSLLNNGSSLARAVSQALDASMSSPEGLAKALGAMSQAAISLTEARFDMEQPTGEPWYNTASEASGMPLNVELTRAARMTMAFASANGQAAMGPALGATRAFLSALPPAWRVAAIEQSESTLSASWRNEMEGIKARALVESGAKQSVEIPALFSGEEPAAQRLGALKAGQPDPAEGMAMRMTRDLGLHMAIASETPGASAADPALMSQLSKIALNPLKDVARYEVASGQSLDELKASVPSFYRQAMDIQACHAALVISSHLIEHNAEPSPQMVSGLKAAIGFASEENQKSLVSQGVAFPNMQWSSVSAQMQADMQRAASFKPKVGALRPANDAPALAPAPELAKNVEAADSVAQNWAAVRQQSFDVGAAVRQTAETKAQAQAQVETEPSSGFIQSGVKAGRALSGFVKNWSPSEMKEKISAKYQEIHSGMERAIVKVNAVLEGPEPVAIEPSEPKASMLSHVSASGSKFASASKQAARSGLESAAMWADQQLARAKEFGGRVGEATAMAVDAKIGAAASAVGGAALSLKDRLPSEQAALKAGMEKQRKAIKWASIGGALLVGVAMAPAAGIVIAAVGGWAAFSGFDKGLEKMAEFGRSATSAAPDKLENLAQRLGARREGAVGRVEPSLQASSPKM